MFILAVRVLLKYVFEMYSTRTILVVLFFCIGFRTMAQQLKLSVNNPAPRVGDELSVSYNIDDPQKGILGIGAVSLMPMFLSASGAVKIGPVSITLNGKTYRSDSLSLNVTPSLPPGMKEGVWIRKVISNNVAYIIIEQRYEEGLKKLTELLVDKVNKLGVNVTFESSQQSIQSTLLGAVQYRISIHRFANVAQAEMMKLDKAFFSNLPENVFFE